MTSVVVIAPSRTRCRSRSPFGRCARTIRHDGVHAVPIGEYVWFGYEGGGRSASHVGYGRFHGTDFCRNCPHARAKDLLAAVRGETI